MLILVMGIGQSNSIGAKGFKPPEALTRNEWPEMLLMPDGPGFMDVRLGLPSGMERPGAEAKLDPDRITGFKPLTSMQSQLVPGLGATPLEGLAHAFATVIKEKLALDVKICVFTSGWGGRLYKGLKKGSIPYDNGLKALQKLKHLADARGWHTWVPFVPVIHGESDSARPEYVSEYLAWQADYESDIQAITRQASPVPFIATQASTFVGSANVYGVLAPYQAVATDSQKFHLASPYYPFAMAEDNLHLGLQALTLGEKIAHSAVRVLGLSGPPSPGTIMPTHIAYDGDRTIDIRFHVPAPPLVQDATHPAVNSPPPPDWGFRIHDGSESPVDISSISIVDGHTVRIVTASPPAPGTSRSVDYALAGYPSKLKKAGQQARGQLRDSDTATSYATGQPLPNWCPHFREFF
ncbi:hypothetical protein [Bordetella petrii]|uniref:hypothetical protein n=1 Tax=Bordetella petrii TaxID=94624 RepID=UPI0038B31171